MTRFATMADARDAGFWLVSDIDPVEITPDTWVEALRAHENGHPVVVTTDDVDLTWRAGHAKNQVRYHTVMIDSEKNRMGQMGAFVSLIRRADFDAYVERVRSWVK